MKEIDYYWDKLNAMTVEYAPKVVVAAITLIIGLLIIKLFRRVLKRLMTERDFDPTLLKFVMDVFTWIFRVLLIISVIGKLGVETTSFVAAIGAAGLAIGLSLQGSLSNFAGGLLIVMFKPFRVGDYIEAQGQAGTVNSIQIFSTRIITPNNQVIYLPNGALSNGTIKNFSQEPLRRTEIVISVAYSSNLQQVKDAIMKIANEDPRVLKDPAPRTEVRTLGESGIDVVVFMWAERPNYIQLVSDFYEKVKLAFEREGIELPFPQRDLHIKNLPGDPKA
ncbi:mechanosensitive ion channel [Flavobacterium sp. J372]|uniref:mechanosensitive ion channel family protein n=1 Tax=Flavobacterium sp. J372 TaxID=2898436 RepID=UPI002151530B|nr:mechanosensitive ion channel domain-containing protein [Flavobacterium sp. J372]MCR5863350.1 mechanosensitive ion channel [Flavobacterium sp. J372]